MRSKPFTYKVLKRRKRGREGHALLQRALKHINVYPYYMEIPAVNPMGYIPKWLDQDRMEASGIISRLQSDVYHQEAYAVTEVE